ncbi:histidine kinase dimerization/phosphoacceptor domain -containing protein [Undibacterium sp. Di24W]|uniref:histidine kinase dimerization/phosphoacceptor domain -containing protein n=1 Tax=Undibacterium sp. Di24W TaxID=3413033 RepID=UPI003BF3EA47
MMNSRLDRYFPRPRWHSISTRITLITLLVCVLGWVLLTFASLRFLSGQLAEKMGLQQFSSATLIAAQVDSQLNSLLNRLEGVSADIGEIGLDQSSTLQATLNNNSHLLDQFSAGVFVMSMDQQLLASLQKDNDKRLPIQIVESIASVSSPTFSKVLDPFVDEPSGRMMTAIVIPIHSKDGQVLGVVAGLINLDAPSMFDYFSNVHYGETGYYVLVAPKSRRIIATTDPKRRMEQLPALGVNPAIDQFVDGVEGSRQLINPKGEHVLSSMKRVNTAGWLIVVSTPITEAFSIIGQIKQRVLLYSAFITLITGSFLLWVIRKQLEPLSLANEVVIAQSQHFNTNIEIPVISQDEIGKLVTDFNNLLTILRERDTALVWSEKRFRAIFDAEPECVKLVKANGKLLDMNAAGLKMLEADSVDQVKTIGLTTFIAEEYRSKFATLFDDVIHGKTGSLIFEAKGLQGSRRWLESHAIPFQNPEDGENMMLAVTRDITQQKQAQMDLLESEFRWKFAIEGSGDGLWDWNIADNSVYFSRRWKEMLGFTEDEVKNTLEEWSSRVHPEDMKMVTQDMSLHLDGETALYRNIHRVLCKSGEWKWILDRGVVVERDEGGKAIRMIGTHADISEQRATQEALQVSLKEKVGLLNEVHHRVKNNLQVITSLLRLESGRSDDSETKNVLNDMQARIRSMALLHESLYRSGIFASADLGAYLRELATHAFRAQVNRTGIHLHLELETVTVSMDQATPCGLMVNELISNSLKHAFSGRPDGEIRLTLQRLGVEGQVRLRISDNGIGMPDDLDMRSERSLGLRLVKDLASQMQGKLETCYQPNTVFTVMFIPDLPQPTTTINAPNSTVRPREFV